MPGDVLVLLAGLGGRGDSYMVWRPGQGEPAAISAPGGTGARMAGNFLMLMTQANAADEFRTFEDGFALMLRPSGVDAGGRAPRGRWTSTRSTPVGEQG